MLYSSLSSTNHHRVVIPLGNTVSISWSDVEDIEERVVFALKVLPSLGGHVWRVGGQFEAHFVQFPGDWHQFGVGLIFRTMARVQQMVFQLQLLAIHISLSISSVVNHHYLLDVFQWLFVPNNQDWYFVAFNVNFEVGNFSQALVHISPNVIERSHLNPCWSMES